MTLDITSYGLRLKYVAPGRVKRSICCFGVRTESRFSISFTCGLNQEIYSFVVNEM